MKKLTVNEQEELFAQDCKLINLRYEYSGFTGTEKWAIITELSEEALWDKYADLLRILDPYENNKMLPARYHDKALACDLIIITTPYNPYEFYQEIFGDISSMPVYARRKLATDSFEQLLRRLSLVIEMNEYWINAMEFDKKCMNFAPVQGASRNNTYSALNRPAQVTLNSVDLFNSIFD